MMTARVYFSWSVVLLCLFACLSTTHARVAVSGQCPAKLMGKVNRRVCTSDRDCSRRHICCTFPRGRFCVLPVSTRPPKPPVKPRKSSNRDSMSCRDDFA